MEVYLKEIKEPFVEFQTFDVPEEVLDCVGYQVWFAVNSTNWKHREAASLAFLDYLTVKGPLRYKDQMHRLFQAAVNLAKLLVDDKV